MKVFKFGGASVGNAEKIKNVANIINHFRNEHLFIVVSAIGKTTNALEQVAESYFKRETENAFQLFQSIKDFHVQILSDLSCDTKILNDFFTEVEWLLNDKKVRSYDYYYDQIVCIGELLSTSIVSHYLNKINIKCQWIDVRDIIRTDNNFRNANIDWTYTANKVGHIMNNEPGGIIVTQGFIGATDENESTTLGREGSDYSAAIFANIINAESQTIWKDVQGVMNADPKLYKNAQWIAELNYREVIEMAFYGAQVIHPKTIKPLQNKNIPLYVKSFIKPFETGTLIHNKNITGLPPIIVYKKNQVLLQFTSKDYSFVGEGMSEKIFSMFRSLKFEPNMTQNAAISLLCVSDDLPEKIEQLKAQASSICEIKMSENLILLTVRHYNKNLLDELCANCEIVLRQQTPETVQIVMRA